MMPFKPYFITFLVSLLGLFVPSAGGPSMSYVNAERYDCEVENSTFQDGERITYVMYYNLTPFWLKAGEVTFTMYDKGETYFVVAEGRTASSFEWFYKVRDTYTCEFDKETMRPIRSSRDIKEGSYRKYSTAEYNFNKNEVIANTGKSRDDLQAVTIAMDECTHDVLSIIYYARNLNYADIKQGTLIPANIFMDDDKYNLGFNYSGTEEKKIKKMGKFETIVLRPQLVAGHVFEEDAEMTIWASNDGNRLPLMVESPVSVGSIKAVLKSYENLRYPLVSAE
jgi:hypothetical protein